MNLDDFVKAADSAKKALREALGDVRDMVTAMTNVENISKSYEAVVNGLDDSDAKNDWKKFQKDIVAMGKKVDDMSIDVRNTSMIFD